VLRLEDSLRLYVYSSLVSTAMQTVGVGHPLIHALIYSLWLLAACRMVSMMLQYRRYCITNESKGKLMTTPSARESKSHPLTKI